MPILSAVPALEMTPTARPAVEETMSLDPHLSFALFGIVWALLCLIAGLLVTDTLVRDRETAAKPAPRATPRPRWML